MVVRMRVMDMHSSSFVWKVRRTVSKQNKHSRGVTTDFWVTVSESNLAHFCGDKNSVLTKYHQDDSDFVCINKKVANTDHDRSVRLFRCEAADGKR